MTTHDGGHGGHGHGGHGDLEAPLLDKGHAHRDAGHSHDGECCDGHDAHDAGHGAHGGHSEHGGHGSHDDHGHAHSGHTDHGHGDHAEEDFRENVTKLKRAVYFALFFMLVEIVGGVCANSLAIITDAAHMMSDVGGFVVSLFALQMTTKAATAEYTYGFKQAEVLGALLSIAIVWSLTAILLWEAVPRLLQPEELDAKMMLIIACIGLIVNIALMKVLGHGHGHDGDDHGHGHGAEGGGSLAVDAAMAHVIGDIIQSLGVIVAALLMTFKPFDICESCADPANKNTCVTNWNYADPLCTVLFSILVLKTTKDTATAAVGTLMAKAPQRIDQESLVASIKKIDGVVDVHDLHVWSLGSKDALCTAHVVIKSSDTSSAVLGATIKAAKGAGIGHCTFQLEVEGQEVDCGGPAAHGGEHGGHEHGGH